jgi:aminoglycoside/choline kinase family phosphotransferase
VALERARRTLGDDRALAALGADDRACLRRAYEQLLGELAGRDLGPARALHGEPHGGNLPLTAQGPRWIDFESACEGPLEWDLAFLDEDAVCAFASVDEDLLALLRGLNSARVATWCWLGARFPQMRWHAEHHLRLVRERYADR